MIVYISSDKISLKRISQSELPLTWPLAPSYIFLVVISQGFTFQRVHLQAKQFRSKRPLVIFGISTISRGGSSVSGDNKGRYEHHSYLKNTMTSLRNHLKKDEKSECLFVIQVAEVGNDHASKKGLKMIENVNKSFHRDIDEGLVEVILVNEKFYPSVRKHTL